MIYWGGLGAFALSLLLTPVARRLAYKQGWVCRPREDRWSRHPIALCGGAAIFAAFSVLSLIFLPKDFPVLAVLLTASAMFLLGLADDFIRIKPSTKLMGQIMGASLAVYLGLQFPLFRWQILNILLAFFWIVAITNAFNLLDNMDGLAAGVGIIASLFLAVVFHQEGQPAMAALALILCGSLAGFLIFNFHPASIFMGDCGSLFVGFLLAVLSMKTASFQSAAASMVVPALALSIPLLDMIFVSVTRIIRGQSVAQGGKDHTSHRLVSLGLSERRAVLTLYALALASGILSFWLSRSPGLSNLIFIPIVLIFFTLLGSYLFNMTAVPGEASTGNPWMTTLLYDLTYKRRMFEVSLDLPLIIFSYYLAYALRFDFAPPEPYLASFFHSLPLIILITYGCFFLTGVYRGIWRFTGTRDVVRFLYGSTACVLVSVLAVVLIYRFGNFPRSVFLLYGILLFLSVTLTRLSFKLIGLAVLSLRNHREPEIPVLIYGAGEGGELTLREILKQNGKWNWKPVGFIDDDRKKHRMKIHGVPILGTYKDLERIYKKQPFKQLLISSDQLSSDLIRQTIRFCREKNVPVKRFRWACEDVSV
ncbi:MAG: glycosyl transferase [Elusimicrobia bacterium]|nr:glycosyl transferase [Elusimicrobiota bacterium]